MCVSVVVQLLDRSAHAWRTSVACTGRCFSSQRDTQDINGVKMSIQWSNSFKRVLGNRDPTPVEFFQKHVDDKKHENNKEPPRGEWWN